MTDQPEALRLAQDLADYWEGMRAHHVGALHRCAVALLREQHEEIERLREQLRLANIDALNESAENAALRAEMERLRDGLYRIATLEFAGETLEIKIAKEVLEERKP